jgi:hypothetical protein
MTEHSSTFLFLGGEQGRGDSMFAFNKLVSLTKVTKKAK